MKPQFYFTVHPGDMLRSRILMGARVLLVASAHWDNARQRFKVRRLPVDHIAGFAIDSGGFTAARRWGKYPWSYQQYVDFIADTARDKVPDFCAVMDYACERGVDRSTYATNIDRIKATIENEQILRGLDPVLPWLPVLQGDTLEERAEDLRLREAAGILPKTYAGIGSVCGRGADGAIRTVKFYADHLPGVRYHGFGMHIQALDDDAVYHAIRSWDSYGWAWGRGKTEMVRPDEYNRADESYSDYSHRMAVLYWDNTIAPRLARDRQITLW